MIFWWANAARLCRATTIENFAVTRLLAVDWGKLKPTECEIRMAKLEADLKASGIRIDALKAKSVKQGLSRQEDLELDGLHKNRKEMTEELTKYKDHISRNE